MEFNKIKFCCQDLPNKSEDGIVHFYCTRTGETIIQYKPRSREYLIIHSEELGTHMEYCPYCGKKMPKELTDEWYDILEKEYGLIDVNPGDYHDKRIPKEFWTDEWWKKRGL
jgi:predicted RNA-binding Zn-ribbon protein involved in translation (DUF1610 family)